MSSSISVCSSFDGGNIEFESSADSGSVHEVKVRIRDDPFTEFEQKHHKQWFFFRSSGFDQSSGKETKFVITNASKCSYPNAWTGYNVCASYDRNDWFRVPTNFDADAGHLHWTMKVGAGQIYFAYFAPYSHERHLDLLGKCCAVAANPAARSMKNHTEVSVRSLGNTLDGRSIDLVTIGSGPLKVWTTARQHPGETMAEFFMEGLIGRLLDETDATARNLRRAATFYCVPNMNPDGSFRGHLRTNACGANLNREWCTTGDYVAPTLHRSPEVYHVLAEMDRVGVDMLMDIHGDELLPYNFILGSEAVPAWDAGPRLKFLQDTFCEAYQQANPDFQYKVGYESQPPKEVILCLGAKQVGNRFNCLAFTLEMPFKDTVQDPNERTGWSPARCDKLGRSILDAVWTMVPLLRKEM